MLAQMVLPAKVPPCTIYDLGLVEESLVRLVDAVQRVGVGMVLVLLAILVGLVVVGVRRQ